MWKPQALDPAKPLYKAIAEVIESGIQDGSLGAGEQLPTHRGMADLLGVNLSTVTKALKECERRGLVAGTVGRGTFVTAQREGALPHGLLGNDSRSLGTPNLLEMGLTLPLYGQEELLEDCVRKVVNSVSLRNLLRYDDSRGTIGHRSVGSNWLNRHGLKTCADDIVIAAGATNALNCCFAAFLRPGDHLAVDCLTYPGIMPLASMFGIRLAPIAMDASGMIPEALDAACESAPIRAVYLMPGAQNPTTTVMTEKRRDEFAEIIERRSLFLFEDDAYGASAEIHLAPLSLRVPDRAAFIGGTSKFLGAGLRIAFVAVSGAMTDRLASAVLSTVWMASPLNAAIVSKVIEDGVAEKVLSLKMDEARARVALAKELLPASQFRCQPAGLFGWLQLSGGWTGKDFEMAAREAGIRIFCAERFSAGGDIPQAVRISLSGPETIGALKQGLQILAALSSRQPIAPKAFL